MTAEVYHTQEHPLLRETLDKLVSEASEDNPDHHRIINNALLQAGGDGFKAGVRTAAGQVQEELKRARTMTAIGCYDAARKLAEEHLDQARDEGNEPVVTAMMRLSQRFGDLTAVIEREQRRAR